MTSLTASADLPGAPPPRGYDDDALASLGELFLDAMLSSASVDVIGVSSWWDRARSALETGCAAGDGVRAVTARTARKLQIDTLSADTARVVEHLTVLLADEDAFARWRQLCVRDAVYIAAMVRIRREDRRETRAAARRAAAPAAAAETAGDDAPTLPTL